MENDGSEDKPEDIYSYIQGGAGSSIFAYASVTSYQSSLARACQFLSRFIVPLYLLHRAKQCEQGRISHFALVVDEKKEPRLRNTALFVLKSAANVFGKHI